MDSVLPRWPGPWWWRPSWARLRGGAVSLVLFKRPYILGSFGAVGAAGVGALLWVLLARATAVGTNFGVLPASSTYRHIVSFVVGKLPSLLQQGVGNFGWLDTPAPRFTLAIWATLCVALVAAVVLAGSKRALLSVLLALLASFIVPVASLIAAARSYGYIGQGRYFLAIWVSVPIVAAGFVGLDARSRVALPFGVARPSGVALQSGVALPSGVAVRSGLALRPRVAIGALVASGQTAAYYWALRRYTVGTRGPLGLSGGSRSAAGLGPWHPPIPAWWLLGVFATLCAVYGVAIATLPSRQQRPVRTRPGHLDEGGAARSARGADPDSIKTDRDIALAGAPSPAGDLELADRGWGEGR